MFTFREENPWLRATRNGERRRAQKRGKQTTMTYVYFSWMCKQSFVRFLFAFAILCRRLRLRGIARRLPKGISMTRINVLEKGSLRNSVHFFTFARIWLFTNSSLHTSEKNDRQKVKKEGSSERENGESDSVRVQWYWSEEHREADSHKQKLLNEKRQRVAANRWMQSKAQRFETLRMLFYMILIKLCTVFLAKKKKWKTILTSLFDRLISIATRSCFDGSDMDYWNHESRFSVIEIWIQLPKMVSWAAKREWEKRCPTNIDKDHAWVGRNVCAAVDKAFAQRKTDASREK